MDRIYIKNRKEKNKSLNMNATEINQRLREINILLSYILQKVQLLKDQARLNKI